MRPAAARVGLGPGWVAELPMATGSYLSGLRRAGSSYSWGTSPPTCSSYNQFPGAPELHLPELSLFSPYGLTELIFLTGAHFFSFHFFMACATANSVLTSPEKQLFLLSLHVSILFLLTSPWNVPKPFLTRWNSWWVSSKLDYLLISSRTEKFFLSFFWKYFWKWNKCNASAAAMQLIKIIMSPYYYFQQLP